MDKLAFLKSIKLFSALSQEAIKEISEKSTLVKFPKDRTIISQGEIGLGMYIIHEGSVKVTERDRGELAILKAGDIFGEASLLTREPCSADVIAEEDTDCLFIERQAFAGILDGYTEVYSLLTEILANRLGRPTDRMVSKDVGNYKILGEIARGGMGVVYKGMQMNLRRVVAIKMLPHELVFNKELLSHFLQEAAIVARLNHPNIVKVYDMEKAYETYFIMMEYVEGKTLKELLKERGPLEETRAVRIVRQLLSALTYAHNQGIVHRDIKPANVIINKDGDAKLMDFGIAGLEGVSRTRAGVSIGTPRYMAPEQIKGENIDKRADIYSLGLLLYEVFTGVHPLGEAKDPASIMHKQLNEKLKHPAELLSDIPKILDRLIMSMLVKDKSRRLGSLDSALEVFDKIPKRGPVEEELKTRISELGKEKKVKSKAFRVVYAAVIIFFILGLGLWLMSRESQVSMRVSPSEKPINHSVLPKPSFHQKVNLMPPDTKETEKSAAQEEKIVKFSDREEAEKSKRLHRRLESLNYYNKGIKFTIDASYKKARDMFKKAIELNPQNGDAHYQLGMVYGILKDKENSLRELKETVALKPEHTGYLFQLGMAYTEQGDKKEALSCFRKILSFDTGHGGARQMIETLSK